MTYVFAYTTSAKDIFWSVPGKFEALFEPEKSESEEDQDSHSNSPSWSEWIRSKLFGVPVKENQENISQNLSSKIEEWQPVQDHFNGYEFTIQSANDFPLSNEPSRPNLTLTLAPEKLSFFEFVSEGWRRHREKPVRYLTFEIEIPFVLYVKHSFFKGLFNSFN